jgi:hypothetical protein
MAENSNSPLNTMEVTLKKLKKKKKSSELSGSDT